MRKLRFSKKELSYWSYLPKVVWILWFKGNCSGDKTFIKNLGLRNEEGQFNLLAQLLSDDVIEAITNSGIKYDEEEEAVDVCQAIQEMRREGEKIGEQKGLQKGELKKHRKSLETFII